MKNTMKKWRLVLLYVVLVISLVSCAQKQVVDLGETILRQDIQAYITELLDSTAEVFTLEIEQMKAVDDADGTMDVTCMVSFGTDEKEKMQYLR